MRNVEREMMQKVLNNMANERNISIKGEITTGHQEMYINKETNEIILNPGAGKCEEGTLEQAKKNIEKFIEDCGTGLVLEGYNINPDENNRYMFKLLLKMEGMVALRFEVLMPGVPLEKVRFMEEEKQNIWDFPRIVVDDESYIWKYGLITKEKIYKLLLNMITTHRKGMDLKFTCVLIMEALAMINKLEKGLDAESLGDLTLATVTISKVAENLHRGYRKDDIKTLDIIIETMITWINEEEQ